MPISRRQPFTAFTLGEWPLHVRKINRKFFKINEQGLAFWTQSIKVVSEKFSFNCKVRIHFDLLQAPHIKGEILFQDQCRLSSKMFHKQTTIRSQMLVASEMRVNGFQKCEKTDDWCVVFSFPKLTNSPRERFLKGVCIFCYKGNEENLPFPYSN